MALLMDERFSNGLPPSLSPNVGLYQGFKGMQIVHTSLVTAIRHWSAPSLIHTLPTEQYNQDIVSLGTHAALTASGYHAPVTRREVDHAALDRAGRSICARWRHAGGGHAADLSGDSRGE